MDLVYYHCNRCPPSQDNAVYDCTVTDFESLKLIIKSNYITLIDFKNCCRVCSYTIKDLIRNYEIENKLSLKVVFYNITEFIEIRNMNCFETYGIFNVSLSKNGDIQITTKLNIFGYEFCDKQLSKEEFLESVKPGSILFSLSDTTISELEKTLFNNNFTINKRIINMKYRFAYQFYIVDKPTMTKPALTNY